MKQLKLFSLLITGVLMFGFKTAETKTIRNTSAAKSILDYYNVLKPQLIQKFKNEYKGMYKVAPLKIVQKDINNGYLSARVGDGMVSTIVTMALWRSKTNKDLIGVFEYNCGGMGCWGEMNDFKIYNSKLSQVQEKLLNWAELMRRLKKRIAGVDSFPVSQYKVMVEIPQKGTSIKITKGVMGVKKEPMATLTYNYNQGSFSIK